jgi:hypothetical protein
MKYGFIAPAIMCLVITSCSFEKRIYQPGFYIHRKSEIVNAKADPNDFSACDKPSRRENVIPTIQKPDNTKSLNQPVEKIYSDTITPLEKNTEEEYVIPQDNKIEYFSEYNEKNHINYTPEMEQKLNGHIDYLKRIQYYSLYPPAWVLIFLMGFFVYRKAKRMAQLSPNKEKHLKDLKKYHRITLIIPILLGAFVAVFSFWYFIV